MKYSSTDKKVEIDSNKLRCALNKAGLTQTEFSEKVGRSPSYISNIISH